MTWMKWKHVCLGGLATATLACSGSDGRPGHVGGDDTDTGSSSSADESETSGSDSDTSRGPESDGGLPEAGPQLDADVSEGDASDDSSAQVNDSGPPPPVTERYDAGTTDISDAGAIDTPCTGNRAFLATGGAFVSPTPAKLAHELNRDIYEASPISLVLVEGESGRQLAASYTVQTAEGHTFPQLQPQFAPATATAEGFAHAETQLEGWMMLERETGPLELPLSNISVVATTSDRCQRAMVTLSAVISADYADLVEEIAAGPADAGDGRGNGEPTATSVRLLFEAELIDFAFDALP